MKYSVLVYKGMWNFQNNSPSLRAGGKEVWALMHAAIEYPTLSSAAAPGCKFTMPAPVCVLQSHCLHAALHEYPGETPPKMLLRLHTMKTTSTLIQQEHLQQKKDKPIVKSYHPALPDHSNNDQIQFFNNYHKIFHSHFQFHHKKFINTIFTIVTCTW
jgi:hypothetical protein